MEELNNNTGLAASQSYCCTCQGGPPTYESTITSPSGGTLSENYVSTVLPPPYSTLDTESYVGDWGTHHGQAFWSRIIKRRGKVWFQYSIEKNNAIPWAGNGRPFFTCGMMPRVGHDEGSVRKTCEAVIVLLKAHRGDCPTCEIQHEQTGGRVCVPSISGRQFRYSMARHDVFCSCRCFDIHYPPQQTLSNPEASGSTLQGIGEYQHSPLDPAWKSEVREGQFYWYRTIQRGGKPRFQCGINRNQRTRCDNEEPDLLFTCKMMPRAGYTQWRVTDSCKNVALALKTHRTAGAEMCSVCDFRHVQGKRTGCPAGIFSMPRAQYLGTMRSHDEACSCRCFHIDRYGRPTANDSSETPRLHAGIERQIVSRELEVLEDRVSQAWEPAPGKGGPYRQYWTRMVKNGDNLWHQYGISEQPSDGRPEFFFTCKMNPRTGRSEQPIRKVCKEIATVMGAHRSSRYTRCTCNFQNWRRPKGPGGCRVMWYHLNTRMIKYGVTALMLHHDRLCSCGCFDVETGDEAATFGQWLRD